MKSLDVVFTELMVSQRQVTDLLLTGKADQDWRPAEGEWSIREVAAHMRQVEVHAFFERIQRIMTEDEPRFSYYLNTGWDFSGCELVETLSDWFTWRQRVFGVVRGLSAEQHTRYGIHDSFGKMTVRDLLNLMLMHDREHLTDLQRDLKLFQLR